MQQIGQPAGDACLEVFFPHLSGLVTEDVTNRGRYMLLQARTPDGPACCPGYGIASSRLHGHTGDFCRTCLPADEQY